MNTLIACWVAEVLSDASMNPNHLHLVAADQGHAPAFQIGVHRRGRRCLGLAVVPLYDPLALAQLDVSVRVFRPGRHEGRDADLDVSSACEHDGVRAVVHYDFQILDHAAIVAGGRAGRQRAAGMALRFPCAPLPRKIRELDSRGEAVKLAIALLDLFIPAALPQQAAAWGDDGHKTVALIAQHYLTPAARKQADAMLAADTDPSRSMTLPARRHGPVGSATPTAGRTTTMPRNVGTSSIWKSPTRT